MKINKKIISLIMVLTMFFMSFNTYAMSISTNNVTQEGTPINFDEGILTKKITNIENNEVTIQLNLAINNNKVISSNSEILFLIDNSSSMLTALEDKATTRKTKVVNSSSELIKKIHNNNPNVKMGIISFASGTQLIQDFTNDENILVNTCNNFVKQSPAGGTSIATSLVFAKQKFSSNVKNKILVLLTDGFPTDGEAATKAQLKDENVYIISTLVGLTGLDDKNKTYIESIFGTEQDPIADRFYNIADKDIETTISKNIYNRILDDFKSAVTNVEIKDYFPEEIINNFDITVNNASKGEITKNENVISWTIDNLDIGKSANLVYTLKLKDGYDTNIMEKIINTNEKVELNYNDLRGNNQNAQMLDTPQIKIVSYNDVQTYTKSNVDNSNSDKNNASTGTTSSSKSQSKKSDVTISKSTIPYTGTSSFVLLLIFLGIISSLILRRKMNSIK